MRWSAGPASRSSVIICKGSAVGDCPPIVCIAVSNVGGGGGTVVGLEKSVSCRRTKQMLVYEKGRVMCRLAIDIPHGHRSAFAFGLPWNVDVIAMVMGKVEHSSGMASVENSLENTAYENTETDGEQKITH